MSPAPAQARVNAGVPAGGEFAATAHAEPTLGLEAPVPFPILGDSPESPEFQAAALDFVVRRGEQLAASSLDIPVIHAASPSANPAAVLAAAVATDKDPNSIPWPEKPANSIVEVYVDADDLSGIMDNGNWNTATGYTQVYASIDLAAGRDCDFWGIDADGNSHVIALGVHDYEEAVDPYDHENLNYREGFTDPMPPYLAAQKATKAKRLEAATALLAEAGVTVELEDLRREQFRLRHGSENLRLETTSYDMRRVIETTNWREAKEDDYDALLGGGTDEPVRDLLVRSAALVARDLKDKGYKELYGR